MTDRPRLCCFDCQCVCGVLKPARKPRVGDLVVKNDRAYLHPSTPLETVILGRHRFITLPRVVTDAYADANDALHKIINDCFRHFIELRVELRITDRWVAARCPWPIDTHWESAVIGTNGCQPASLRLVMETNRNASLSFVVGIRSGPAYLPAMSAGSPARFYVAAKTTQAALVLHHTADAPLEALAYAIGEHFLWRRDCAYGRPAQALPLITIFVGAAEHRAAAVRATRVVLGAHRFTIDEPLLDRTVKLHSDGSLHTEWLTHAEHRWPHAAEYIRDAAMVLYATGLSVWPLMWLLDWLPGMLQWREIAKMRIIDRTYASVRRVLDARFDTRRAPPGLSISRTTMPPLREINVPAATEN